MGYHVSIVNNSKTSNVNKILYNPDQVITKMQELGFVIGRKNGIFFYKEDKEFAIFYDDNCLWSSNPDEELLEVLIEVANSFSDGSIVVGDNGETYKCLSDIYSSEFVYENNAESIIKRFVMFLYYRIFFIIPILLVLIKIFVL